MLFRSLGVEADEGEHLAADGFVADPEHEIFAELDGLDDVGELVEEGAGALYVHWVRVLRNGDRGLLRLR